jgi:hypothetical protein
LALAVACFLLLGQEAVAGWYHVENYEGFIGPYPVHFSLQTYDSFGSGITAEGSYYYDAKQSPVAIYGNANGKELTLCEISDDAELDRILIVGSKTPVITAGCPFSLVLEESEITGTWSRDANQFPVSLRRVAGLDDTGSGRIEGTVEIPFWAQTAAHRFSGIYTNTDSGICMEKLQIVNKGSRKVDQEIAFDKNDCNAGMLMTPIYLNVEKQPQNGVDVVSVDFRDNRAGYSTDYIFNRAAGRYSQKK